MKRRQLLVGGGAVAASALAGCVGSAQTSPSAQTGGSTRTITVSSTGETTADPDLAIIRTSIEATGNEATAVRDELSTRSEELYQALVDAGIEEDRITTERFGIYERVDRRRPPESSGPTTDDSGEVRSYEGVHEYSVEITDIESVGQIVDTAVDAGADSVGRIEYTLSDEKRATVREDALNAALEGARSEADYIAAEVDASVVEVTTVDTAGGGVTPYRSEEAYDQASAGSRSTQLQPGDVTVRATARVSYTIS